MPKLTIDGHEIEVAAGTTIMQACEALDIQVPHFCYHGKLSSPANCRMCMVEVEKMPKPVPSCAQPCGDGMVVKTHSPALIAARKAVMEALLINHPLDCPVCDQGGECDLQDQAVTYGRDRSRYRDEKRIVSNKEMGPLVKTVMTRCIACTRCIRFMDEIAGTPQLGKIHRGEKTEITNLDSRPLTSELSGNLIDVCPVGALTAKPYAFRARAWEMKKVATIDVSDAVGSALRVDVRGDQIMRVLPRRNEAVNELWISDKARFSFDGLSRQRLDKPLVRKDGKLEPVSWDEAFAIIAARVKKVAPEQVAALAGDDADGEAMFALKQLMAALGAPHLDCRQDGAAYDVSQRAAYLMNTTIEGLEKADAVLLIGTNPRWEGALVNARLRKAWRKTGVKIGMIGTPCDLSYPYEKLGNKPGVLQEILDGRNGFAKVLAEAERPALIVGAGAFARFDGLAVQDMTYRIAEKFGMLSDVWNGYNVLQTAAARVAGLDMGFLPGGYGMDTRAIMGAAAAGRIDTVFLLSADEIDVQSLGGAFVVYQGHHGDWGARRADVVLPGAAFTEKEGLYVNTEGRAQRTAVAVPMPGEAREDWRIITDMAAALGRPLPFADVGGLRASMVKAVPSFGRLGEVGGASFAEPVGQAGKLSAHPLTSEMRNFYLTDAVCRASPTMAQCVAEIVPHAKSGEGA